MEVKTVKFGMGSGETLEIIKVSEILNSETLFNVIENSGLTLWISKERSFEYYLLDTNDNVQSMTIYSDASRIVESTIEVMLSIDVLLSNKECKGCFDCAGCVECDNCFNLDRHALCVDVDGSEEI